MQFVSFRISYLAKASHWLCLCIEGSRLKPHCVAGRAQQPNLVRKLLTGWILLLRSEQHWVRETTSLSVTHFVLETAK